MISVGTRRGGFVAAVAIVLSGGIVRSSSPQAASATVPVTRLTVSFKLDPRLMGGTYGGERWVSPPTYNSAAQEGKEATVEAKVGGVDAGGRAVSVSPEWIPTEPEMVVVSPVAAGRLDHVRLTVKKPGESRLVVASQGVTKDLLVKAQPVGTNAIQVAITQ